MELEDNEKEFDARDVLDEITAYRNEFSESTEQKRSSLARSLSTVLWLFGIIVVLLSYFVWAKKIVIPHEYVFIYAIASIISLVSMIVSTYREYTQSGEMRDFLRDPVSDLLKAADSNLTIEIRLYAKLDRYSIDALTQARNYLNRKKTRLELISNIFVGVLSKVGLLPAILAVAIVALKIYSEVGLSPVLILPLILIGFYLFCFKVIEASIRFDEYQSIVNDYLEMRKGRQD
jgi:hypothetical protein